MVEEIEGLKLELQEVKSKVGIEVNPDVVKIKMQARQVARYSDKT